MSHTINKKRNHDLRRLHESNYQLILQLIPNLREINEHTVSSLGDVDDLHLHILEHSPYTTVLALTHMFSAGEVPLAAPDLWVRVYHDACVAEAIANQDGNSPAHSKIYTWHRGLDTDIKWQLNMFMEKWLRRCLLEGHRFNDNAELTSSIS